jgi:CelD/BcsL family acetyltransferase involved in cellulose biosynthesis
MMLSREAGIGRIFRRLRFIGDGTFETDHMNFLVGAGDRSGVLAALLVAIDSLPWDIAHFSQIPRESEHTQQLLDFASSRGWLLSASEVPCPRRTLPESYDGLMRSLPSRMRTAIRSARRNLEESYSMEFGMCTDRDDLPTFLEALYRNHTSRWQSKGREGVFVGERKRLFYSRLSYRLLDAGSLRFYYLKLNGAVIAQQYCFQHGNTVYLLQEGFDFDYAEKNVGNVLRAMVFEDLISRGVRHYDFLAGTSRHKRSWSDSEPIDLSVQACRPSIIGRTAHHLPLWWAKAKQLIKRSALRPIT